jgi:hypothetical protein
MVYSTSNVARKYTWHQLHNITNSGAEVALNDLTVNGEDATGSSNIVFNGGSFSYDFQLVPADLVNPQQYRITVIGEFRDLKDTVVVTVTQPSFSRFCYFTNHESGAHFVSGDTLRGPVHTNEFFYMAGNPVFLGKVTSSEVYSYNSYYPDATFYTAGWAYWYCVNWSYDNGVDPSLPPDFVGGTEWNVPKIPMPDGIPDNLILAAQNDGIILSNRYNWLNFNSDGTVDIAGHNYWSTNPPDPSTYTTYTLSDYNGVIYADYTSYSAGTDITVEGTVDGQVTVASAGDINIRNDLICADNPGTNPDSDDIIGLVANRDCRLVNNKWDQDRIIQASIMTFYPYGSYTHNFYNQDWNRIRSGMLRLYGGLIEQWRGATASPDGSSYLGYLMDYQWDPRLEEMKPPYYPMVLAFKKVSWWD